MTRKIFFANVPMGKKQKDILSSAVSILYIHKSFCQAVARFAFFHSNLMLVPARELSFPLCRSQLRSHLFEIQITPPPLPNTTHQLPVEGPPGVGALLTQQSAVVLGLSTDTDGLNHLGEVDKVHELHCLVGAGVCGCMGCGVCGVWSVGGVHV